MRSCINALCLRSSHVCMPAKFNTPPSTNAQTPSLIASSMYIEQLALVADVLIRQSEKRIFRLGELSKNRLGIDTGDAEAEFFRQFREDLPLRLRFSPGSQRCVVTLDPGRIEAGVADLL